MTRGLLSLGLVLVTVLAAFGVELHSAHEDSRRAAERRFVQRAQISAALTQSVFGALGNISAPGVARELGGSRTQRRTALTKMVGERKLGYAAVLSRRGAVLDAAGRARPPRDVARTPGSVSDVRRSAAGRLVEFDIPFRAPSGGRSLVLGVPVTIMRSFLEDYLRRLPSPDGATLLVADRRGTVLARVVPAGGAQRVDDPLIAAARVPRTTWRLRLQADRARVLAGTGGDVWLGWALLAALALATGAGLCLGARVVASSRRRSIANRALRESEGKLRALVGALEEAVFLLYADGSIELLNDSAKALAGTDADFTASAGTDWVSVSDDGVPITAADTPAGISFANGTPERRVIGMDRRGRERVWLDVSTRPLFRPGEIVPYAVVSSCTDVTARQNLEAHLLDLADRDPLTGLWNRRRLEQDIAYQIARCRRYDEHAGLVLLDIDGFKQVNEVLGHLAGDEVLCALGDALSSRLRVSDRAARVGGDQFAVLLVDVDGEAVARIAAEFAGKLSAAAAVVQERVSLSISVGTALLDRRTGGVDAALEMADRAMYTAKHDRVGGTPPPPAPPPTIAANGQMSSLRALLAAVNARDSYTAMHSREVVTLARGVARRLGLDELQTSEVEHIALLHDLGKIAIPDAILRKPGPLTSHEQTLMRQHPVVGGQILASMPELAHLAPAVRAEHERWDGGGYPDGLTGAQIPIASRIALVCDAYHAMTSTRPYRRAMSPAAACDEIRREAGAQFCPYAAAALLEVLVAVPADTSPSTPAQE